jgi:alkanesulfonate monooxygenase SsuD/methylene tetrahydromethanopterin reductase-like flavin-dependent oxidoreductase (luciferase family)
MLPQTNQVASPEALVRTAEAAESLGFDAISVRDHIVYNGAWITSGMRGLAIPGADDRNIFEAMLTLAFVASRTSRIRLGTSVIVLPNRHPLLFAKQVSTLDVLSGGRLIVGIGVGPNRRPAATDTIMLGRHRTNLEKEYDAFGATGPRGRRMDEYVQAAIAIWTQPLASFHGEFVTFDEVDVFPKPIQKPYPPLLIGGRSEAAQQRVAAYADGWIPSQVMVGEIREGLAAIRALRAGFGRPPTPDLVGINVHSVIAASDVEAEEFVTPTIGHMFADADALRGRTLIGSVDTFRRRVLEYRDAGVDYVEIKPVYRDIDHLIDQLRLIHDEIMPAVTT